MRFDAGCSGSHRKSFGLFLPELGPHFGAALFLWAPGQTQRRPGAETPPFLPVASLCARLRAVMS
jgi:hypothetical protein